MSLNLSDFNYNLPPALIAQNPAKPRDHSRLLVLNKESGAISHDNFFCLPKYLKAGDVLVINNSKVFPARLIGQAEMSGGRREVFLHHKLEKNIWECLVKGKARVNLKIKFAQGLEAILVKDKNDGTWEVRFNQSGKKFLMTIEQIGQVPLPPYIKREKQRAADRNSYQTVYAADNKLGSVAAPTAGLHFTPALLKKIQKLGVEILSVTLHVGLGTFAAVKTEDITKHEMHSELVEISARVQRRLLKAKSEGRRIIAVGTTSCRTLETWGQAMGLDKTKIMIRKEPAKLQDFQIWTRIFIYPGYEFRVVDALVTNFHLPKSTLLMLVGALAGKDNIDKAYSVAIQEKYRFFSYGDAMLIY